MSVSVRIPTILRTYTGGESQVQADGNDLGAVLDALDGSYPGLKGRVVADDGELRRFVNVYVNDEDVRFSGGLATTVADGAEISIIPAVAGG